VHRSLVLLAVSGWALGCSPPNPPADRPASARVRPGIEVLLSDSVELVRGRRVGLVSNQSGVDSRGTSDVTRLRDAGIDLVALFSPEHGFRGAAAPGAVVASSVDSATGLPIYSLYGRTSAPTDEMLEGIEVMLVDLQDAGARYYTYLFTTIEVMKAAARKNVAVVVLDRPNPIGGMVQGNLLDPAYASAVGSLATPMRHGMTLAELARLAKSDLHLEGSLSVVPVAGWHRTDFFDQIGLPFVPPSPNLKTLESLFHYPGLCLFEGTNLSVGRGSDAPFTQIGAPWLDTTRVLADMRKAELPGVRFSGVVFTPKSPGDGKYADTTLMGIRLTATDRASYDPTATAVYLLAAVRASGGERFGWIPAHFDRLAGGPALRAAIEAGMEPARIVMGWSDDLKRFRERRRGVLLYPE
jgi:uncharacterized protein YbbC (DUF1343 family)